MGIIIGLSIRGTINKERIFRYRKGNGYIEGDEKDHYQDQYPYYVPVSINNPEGQHARDVFTAAVAAWHVLSDSTKTWWRSEVRRLELHMTGFNLYIKGYMRDNL